MEFSANKTDYKPQLRKIIERHRGRANAIKRAELWNYLGIQTESADRRMRLQIAELRKSGLPILFATSKPSGYYLPDNQKEVNEGRSRLQSIIIDECVTLAALKTYGARFVQKEEQIPMI